MISRLITEERKKQLETFKYPDDILTYLDKMQEEHHYTDEEMEKDLGVALWKLMLLITAEVILLLHFLKKY